MHMYPYTGFSLPFATFCDICLRAHCRFQRFPFSFQISALFSDRPRHSSLIAGVVLASASSSSFDSLSRCFFLFHLRCADSLLTRHSSAFTATSGTQSFRRRSQRRRLHVQGEVPIAGYLADQGRRKVTSQRVGSGERNIGRIV